MVSDISSTAGDQKTGSPPWYYRETGAGTPLVLLHGLGMSHVAWSAVIPHLQQKRCVIAFDIAGFGHTPPLLNGTIPSVPNLVDGLESSLRKIGIHLPVDIAGNSLGGYMALEAAMRGIAKSVVAISPAGLWRNHEPGHVKYVFRTLRFTSQRFPQMVKRAMRVPLLREVALAVPLSVGSRRMSASDAVRAVHDLASSKAFEATFVSIRPPFSGRGITVPLTVAFGERDYILPKGSRVRSELPKHTRWVEVPNWGHVPMWVDPEGVAQLILDGIAP
jgi:pimeloyl-ACP methyl ester carboxylesterase